MFKFENSEIMVMDKYLGKEWLALNTRNPRNCRDKWVAELKDTMNKGLFLEGDIAFARLDYELDQRGNELHVLVNGQHQLKAFLGSVCKSLKVRKTKYSCASPEDLSLLWRQFDAHSPRTHAQRLKIEADSLGLVWQTETLRRIGAAILVIEGKQNAFKEVKVKLLRDYRKEGTFVDQIFSGSPHRKHISKSPVVHAMIKTWQKSPYDANLFWIAVRDGESLKKTHPAYILREFLKGARLYRGHTNSGLRYNAAFNIVTEHEITSRCITAWNAFRKGVRTSLKYYIHKPIPEAI